MITITVPYLSISEPVNNTEIDLGAKHRIDNLLWSETGYKPDVSFSMGYTDDSIFLKYFVAEQYVKAEYQRINDPVYKDSCVEFFIGFGDNGSYYNFEFNNIGTALVGYGAGKQNRTDLKVADIARIKTWYSIPKAANNSDNTKWELLIQIPFDVFVYEHITSLTGQAARANFYKCGDDLPVPHFMSWSNINHPEPNFHLPQFFGKIIFG